MSNSRSPPELTEGQSADRKEAGARAPREPRARNGRRAAIGLIAAILALALAAALAPWLLPGALSADAIKIAAAAIFAGSYLGLALGKVPGLTIDRAGVALVGASLMVAAGAVTLRDAYGAIDFDTIALLLGVMIVVANLRLSGFFALANRWMVRRAHRPIVLLAAVTAVSGIFSAFLVNDAICLVLSPLVLQLTTSLKRKPTPYLLAVAMASNVGSTATITGNPQNIMIGSFSHIPYEKFVATLAPVALFGLVLTVALIPLVYREEFVAGARLEAELAPVRVHKFLIWRAVIAVVLMVALFFAGQSPAKVAIVVGALLLLTRRVRSERVYAEIDWSLLLMFVGLFIIVAGAQHRLLTSETIAVVANLHLDAVPVLSAVTAVLSNLVSNVPAVLVLKPFIEELPNHQTAWLAVAMASTLAGNFTVLGSVANLIVVQRAAASGVRISFWDYFKVGAPLTLLTITVGVLWLSL